MGLFSKKQGATTQLSQQQVLENAVKSSRNNILIVLAFTVVNIVLMLAKSNTYFLFSAYVPYMLVDYGMFFGGVYPPEYYGEYITEIEFLGKGFFGAMLAVAVVVLAMYALCWLFAQKKPKTWLTFALILVVIDTALLLWMAGISAALILDYVFHGWIIVSLITGLSAVKKLKELPAEEAWEDLPAEEEELDALPVEE